MSVPCLKMFDLNVQTRFKIHAGSKGLGGLLGQSYQTLTKEKCFL